MQAFSLRQSINRLVITTARCFINIGQIALSWIDRVRNRVGVHSDPLVKTYDKNFDNAGSATLASNEKITAVLARKTAVREPKSRSNSLKRTSHLAPCSVNLRSNFESCSANLSQIASLNGDSYSAIGPPNSSHQQALLLKQFHSNISSVMSENK
jgi:hypothetical protein